ncbi:MAG TPA: hypothetical protein VKX17_20255 [Planctomycetota bacterium]|nr:hypothetical protein [Planctomycetota bacterium]
MRLTILLAALLFAFSTFASERALADSLAATGSTLAAKGNLAAAKDMFYKALANDETCPDAIFELAKIFDKENNAAAACDFYQRASLIMAQENKTNTTAKRAEADKRVRALNPFAPRMLALLEDYAQDLDKLVKKVPDTITQDAALARVNELKMPNVIAPAKLPKFYADAQAAKVADADANKNDTTPKPPKRSSNGFSMTDPKPVTKVAPDVERELKEKGWTTITGVWVKKSPGVYEVTDGKLEVAKVNGAVDVSVQRGTGTVKVAVRNDFNGNDTFYSDYTGYGMSLGKREVRVYTPSSYSGMMFGGGSRMDPTYAKSELVPEANPRNRVMMTVADGVLEYTFNDKRILRISEPKLPRTGPFVIEVKGTMIIENPRCAGQ